MAGLGPRSAIERAEIGNSRPTVVRACALLDPPTVHGVTLVAMMVAMAGGAISEFCLGVW
jgi:hypothetical protein